MRIELLGVLDYAKLRNVLKDKVDNCDEIIEQIKLVEREQRTMKISAAGRLSRFPGTIFEILEISENNEFSKNLNFIKRVIGMGHDSITDHDYCVFALQDISPVIEQIIIAERICSFTVKSRREVDFSKAGFYTPDFHDEKGNILTNNEEIKKEYNDYMTSLFQKYAELVEKGVTLEDARFVLPYCYHSNIIMGVDAHTLKDMIIKFTKTKYAKIQELYEFGMRLKEIATEEVPYIISQIDGSKEKFENEVDRYLDSLIENKSYRILDKPKLLNCSSNVDDTILISSIMRRYQFDYDKAKQVYSETIQNDPVKRENLMRKIAFESDQLELTQVNFEFQIPLTYAVLTHLTRHRIQDILVSDFVPVIDLTQYKVPSKIKELCLDEFDEIFKNNQKKYKCFKEKYHIRDEDLVYFTLSGNMTNVITNMNGKSLAHILRLRECSKAQWETQEMAYGMHKEIKALDHAQLFSSILGPTCETQKYCKEGKESCGRIIKILENENKEKIVA